tara:strand:+ start:399 stop:1073 length:675 start_codon:yes stop_codon:yes gene_type:complete
MANHYNNKSDDNTKIQDFYNSRNQMGGINIIDQRGFCTRNSEEAKIKKDYPFITLSNNSEIVIQNDNFRNATTTNAPIEYHNNQIQQNYDYKDKLDNYRDVANERISQLSPFNNNITDYKYLTHDDFLMNKSGDKNQRDTNNERISSFQNINYSGEKNEQNQFKNNFIDERNMFNEKNDNINFKQAHNNRMSALGQLPSNSAFPVINQNNFCEIKSINTRNIKE